MVEEKTNNLTTIAIYKDDVKELEKLMKRGERYREKIHDLILKEKESEQ